MVPPSAAVNDGVLRMWFEGPEGPALRLPDVQLAD